VEIANSSFVATINEVIFERKDIEAELKFCMDKLNKYREGYLLESKYA
jgi:hypothetical protein